MVGALHDCMHCSIPLVTSVCVALRQQRDAGAASNNGAAVCVSVVFVDTRAPTLPILGLWYAHLPARVNINLSTNPYLPILTPYSCVSQPYRVPAPAPAPVPAPVPVPGYGGVFYEKWGCFL